MDIRKFFGAASTSKKSKPSTSVGSSRSAPKSTSAPIKKSPSSQPPKRSSQSLSHSSLAKTGKNSKKNDDDSETEMEEDLLDDSTDVKSNVSPAAAKSREKSSKISSIKSLKSKQRDDSDTEMEDDLPESKVGHHPKTPPKASTKKSKRELDEGEIKIKYSSPRRTSPRKRKGSPPNYKEENYEIEDKVNSSSENDNYDGKIKSEETSKIRGRGNERASGGKRKLVIDDSDEDTDMDSPADNVNNSKDDDDEDFEFHDDDDNADENEDEDFSEEHPKREKGLKRQKVANGQSPKKSSRKVIEKESPAKASRKSEKPTSKQPAAVDSSTRPKYHPPSSLLTTHIPFLKGKSIQVKEKTQPLPKSSNGSSNGIKIDDLSRFKTPLCLEGLTFVLSGILTTDPPPDANISNEAVEEARKSPTKGSYHWSAADHSNPANANQPSNTTLAREDATDLIKILGGRVTTAVSSKTDYLIVGNILEDGRKCEEGSKFRKCLEAWDGWKSKYGDDFQALHGNGDEESPKKKGRKSTGRATAKKTADPNSLVEIVRGINEFHDMICFLSDWKFSSLSDEQKEEVKNKWEQDKVDLEQQSQRGSSPSKLVAKTIPPPPASSSSSMANPYAKKPVSNPYVKTPSSAPASINNPYAKKSPMSNPYASKSISPMNPYKKSPPNNPYGSAPSNPYAKSSGVSTTPPSASHNHQRLHHHQDSEGKVHINALWADKYAPKSSKEILGNGDCVNKLSRWLNGWESQFNNPQRKVKSISGPNGPWKAALLSGPPGIGKTTTATLIARESNRDVLELNASDARSKKALTESLGDVTGSQVLHFGNTQDSKFKQSKSRNPSNSQTSHHQLRCIIMDEVDGMGAGDRSGISELIQMIKKSKVPIICICNDRQSQKMKSLVQYCMDLRYRRPTKSVIARRAVEVGNMEGMEVEANAAEAMAESCGNDIRQVLNCLQMWSCKKKSDGGSASMTYRDLKNRQGDINKDEVLRVSIFDATKLLVEGDRGLAGADNKAITSSILKRSDAYFVDYMLMGLNVHQNYLKVMVGQFNDAKLRGDEETELQALNQMHDATMAMSDFGLCEEQLRGGDQNWSLLPLCAMLAVKVGHHAGGQNGGLLPGYPEFAGWLGKNSSRNKKIRLLQELQHHLNYKVSADAPELRMNYLPIMREQFQSLLFDQSGAKVGDAIELMDEYGLDRDDVFENLDEFLLSTDSNKDKKFGDLDSKSKAAFTRAYNQVAHRAQALVAEQGAEKKGRKKGGEVASELGGGELDVVDDDKNLEQEEGDGEEEEDVEALKSMFKKKSGGKGGAKASNSSKSSGKNSNGAKKGKKK